MHNGFHCNAAMQNAQNADVTLRQDIEIAFAFRLTGFVFAQY